MMQQKCSCITTSNGKKLYFLVDVDESALEWHFKFSDGETGWCGTVDKSDLDVFATKVSHTLDEFIKQFKHAFHMCTPTTATTFSYKISQENNGDEGLCWSTYLDADEITFNLGCIKLERAASADLPSLHSAIFNGFLIANSQLLTQCDQLTEENKKERATAASALKKLDEFVSAKEANESILFNNFVEVLNEKKRKIRELTDQCTSLQMQFEKQTDVSSTQLDSQQAVPGKSIKPRTSSRQTRTVSACRKPSRKTALAASTKTVSYDSDTDEDEIESVKKPVKPLSQTDDDQTDIEQDTNTDGNSEQLGKIQSEGSTPVVTGQGHAKLSSNLVDDLLGELNPVKSRKLSPVKRPKVTANKDGPPEKDSKPKPTRTTRRSLTKEESSLLDELL